MSDDIMIKQNDGFFERLKEPSTYAGIAAAFAGLGLLDLDAGAWNGVFASLTVLFGAVAGAVKERRG